MILNGGTAAELRRGTYGVPGKSHGPGGRASSALFQATVGEGWASSHVFERGKRQHHHASSEGKNMITISIPWQKQGIRESARGIGSDSVDSRNWGIEAYRRGRRAQKSVHVALP